MIARGNDQSFESSEDEKGEREREEQQRLSVVARPPALLRCALAKQTVLQSTPLRRPALTGWSNWLSVEIEAVCLSACTGADCGTY